MFLEILKIITPQPLPRSRPVNFPYTNPDPFPDHYDPFFLIPTPTPTPTIQFCVTPTPTPTVGDGVGVLPSGFWSGRCRSLI